MILILTFSPACSSTGPETFRIPKVEGLTVDGSADDWGEQGFRVEILTSPDGQTLPVDDFDVKLRLSWDLEGLYVLITVRDDIPAEHESLSRLWRMDCVEISVAEKVGHANKYMLAVASGADPEYGKLRKRLYDWRPEGERPADITSETASRFFEGGQMIEAMLPWKNLGLNPITGMEFGFQLVANDVDGQGDGLRVAWFPGLGPTDSNKMHRLSLAEKPSEPVLSLVDQKIAMSKTTVTVQAASDLIGQPVVIRSGDKTVAQKPLVEANGRAHAVFVWNVPEGASVWPELSLSISGKPTATFEELPVVGRILETYIQASGGRGAIEKLVTRSCQGRYSYGVNAEGAARGTYKLEAYAQAPNKWIASIHKPDYVERNAYDGKIGWLQGADRIERNNRLGRAILGWCLNPHGPLLLQTYFPNLSLKEKTERDGQPMYVIESEVADGTKHTLEFEAKTGLLSRIDDRWLFEDYRRIDGVLLPARITIRRDEDFNIFELDEVKHNDPIEETTFSKPDEAVVFADAFKGIEDKKVLPMLTLKDLTYEHGEMNIPIRDGRFLYDLILEHGYKRGLEIGTYNGYSTLWFGLAFRRTGGKVITIEIDEAPAREAQQNFIKAGLDGVIETRVNDAFKEITKIKGEFDFVFIDANKEDYGRFWKMLKDRIKSGGALIGHNVTNYARDMEDFLDAIRTDPDFTTTFHETSSEGISVSIRKK